MGQNNIWIYFFRLGLISLIISLASCKKDRSQYGEYHFVNDTNYTIKFEKGMEIYDLAPKTSIKILNRQDGSKPIDPQNYVPPLMILSDGGLTIQFDQKKCLDFFYNSEHSILNINNYVNGGMINKSTYKFTYTFTEADYNRAVLCP